jgi:CheY-like chemotaxis protein
MARILVIDDDEVTLTVLRGFLRNGGHTVHVLNRSDAVLDVIKQVEPDLVVTDIMMPGSTGGAVYAMIRDKVGSQLPVIVCSGTKLRIKHDSDKLFAYCPKPVQSQDLLDTVARLLLQRDMDESTTETIVDFQ